LGSLKKKGLKRRREAAELAEAHDTIIQAAVFNQKDIFQIILIHLPRRNFALLWKHVASALDIARRER
jgi:hypothetical protein